MKTLSLFFAAFFFQDSGQATDLGMKHLPFLIAAYTVIWLVIGIYIWILVKRNKKLNDMIGLLERRVQSLEQETAEGSYGPQDEA